MFSLHVDTARTWRGGQNQVLLTVNGLRSIGQRAALVAHPDGELRRRAAEGLDLIPIAPRTGDGSVGGVEVLAARQAAAARRDPRARSARRRDGVAGAVDRIGVGERPAAAGAGRGAARRLSPEGQFVLALEVPAGGLLHRRVRGDPPDARRRRRAGRPNGDGARRDRRRARRARRRRSTSTRRSGCRTARRSSATSPRSCRTRGSAT